MRNYRVLLVSMPWQRADAPSLQLGILKARLVREGVRVKTLHAAPLLSRKLGSSLYWRVANNLHPLLSEACFAFVRRNVRQEALREALIATEELTEAESARVMDTVRDFCATLRERAPWRGFDVAGFSCTFNQLQASLWAAQEARRHGCRTLFGGFLTQGGMGEELLRSEWVDAVIDGPGEKALPDWLRQGCPPGLFRASCDPVEPLIPDYSDYVADMQAGIKDDASMEDGEDRENGASPEQSALLLEASRGCEHGVCAFCAQNQRKGRVVYDAAYVEDCLKFFADRFPGSDLEFADTSFPFFWLAATRGKSPLRTGKKKWRAFAECRCPTPLQMRRFSLAGFESLQIGVESLHSAILRRMRKGATLLQNICCLRESWNCGLNIHYNIILDMPGTRAEEIEEMLELLPLLHHLPPPTALVSFQLQRNSPVFRNPRRYGLDDVRPHPWHTWLGREHPPFYFVFHDARALAPSLLEKAHEAFMQWETAFTEKAPLCAARFSGSGALVTDGRFARPRQYHLPRAAARVLLACRTPQPRARLLAVGKERTGELLRELTQRNLLLEEDGCYAALPVLVPEKRELLSLSRRDPIDSWFSPPIATAREEATYAH